MLAAGDSPEVILEGYPWLEPGSIRAVWSTPGVTSAMSGLSRADGICGMKIYPPDSGSNQP